MQTVTTPAEVRAFTAGLSGKRLALVPTMGFLHAGHQALIAEGARRADAVAVSIFVNPTQFGPTEDLARYPKDLDGDLRKCAEAGAVLVYAPQVATVYPPGFQTSVDVERVSKGLDGASRPGHFRGVATVVTKLLALFRPHVALFGEKDYQQLQVIGALARDLELGVEIVGVPTVRDEDGLAMSSRNTYLSPQERAQAPMLSGGLMAAEALVQAGELDVGQIKKIIRHALREGPWKEDFVEVVDAVTLEPLAQLTPGRPARALAAAFLGKTRLIDNVALEP
ncbi:MAG: pantoate--beta-alanine ligase [Myxococcaceae bacterium]|nr:pantoate--beta-alanine ligase [Myxococcaceae bacterium]